MKKLTTLMLAGAGLLAALPSYSFQAGMSSGSLDTEVHQRLATGESLKAIDKAAEVATISPASLTTSLILNGIAGSTTVTSLVEAGLAICPVVGSAVASGYERKAMIQAAIAGGADPNTSCLLDPTAAAPGGAGGAPAIGQSRASTYGGGGGNRSVSRS